jgi:hypothetical protein
LRVARLRHGTATFAATAWMHRMTDPTTGLNVRFFSVKMATGRMGIRKSIGKAATALFSALKTRNMQAGTTVT